MKKATFRLPDPLLDALRERSRHEGRSINAVTIDALWRGLDNEAAVTDLNEIFGELLVKPATARFSPEAAERALADIPPEARDLMDALEWTRGDR